MLYNLLCLNTFKPYSRLSTQVSNIKWIVYQVTLLVFCSGSLGCSSTYDKNGIVKPVLTYKSGTVEVDQWPITIEDAKSHIRMDVRVSIKRSQGSMGYMNLLALGMKPSKYERLYLLLNVYCQNAAIDFANGRSIPNGIIIDVSSPAPDIMQRHMLNEPRWLPSPIPDGISLVSLRWRYGHEVQNVLPSVDSEPDLEWTSMTPATYYDWWNKADERFQLSRLFGTTEE